MIVRRTLPKPTIIVVSGPPASGKSTLAVRLSNDLGLPLLSKDHIKEQLFESLGSTTRRSSIQLGRASFQLLLSIASELYRARSSFILENAFRASDGEHIQSLVDGDIFLQVYCHAPIPVLIERFSSRVTDGSRHPGHADADALSELKANLDAGVYGLLDLPGECCKLDTTSFKSTAYSDGYSRIIQMCTQHIA